jgi:hypothetical protein
MQQKAETTAALTAFSARLRTSHAGGPGTRPLPSEAGTVGRHRIGVRPTDGLREALDAFRARLRASAAGGPGTRPLRYDA